ncbi:Ethylene-responsive transcription factor [Nymphaea thermarum]|nr:Ethylene-responsive transcription factor [Nymphaea thermarum]
MTFRVGASELAKTEKLNVVRASRPDSRPRAASWLLCSLPSPSLASAPSAFLRSLPSPSLASAPSHSCARFPSPSLLPLRFRPPLALLPLRYAYDRTAYKLCREYARLNFPNLRDIFQAGSSPSGARLSALTSSVDAKLQAVCKRLQRQKRLPRLLTHPRPRHLRKAPSLFQSPYPSPSPSLVPSSSPPLLPLWFPPPSLLSLLLSLSAPPLHSSSSSRRVGPDFWWSCPVPGPARLAGPGLQARWADPGWVLAGQPSPIPRPNHPSRRLLEANPVRAETARGRVGIRRTKSSTLRVCCVVIMMAQLQQCLDVVSMELAATITTTIAA